MHQTRLRIPELSFDTQRLNCRPSVSCSGGTQRCWSLSSTQATPCCCKLLPCPSRSRPTIQPPTSWLLSKPLACRSLHVHAAQSSLLLQLQDFVLSTRMCKCVVCHVMYPFACCCVLALFADPSQHCCCLPEWYLMGRLA